MLAISDIILINYLYSAVCIIISLSRHSHSLSGYSKIGNYFKFYFERQPYYF